MELGVNVIYIYIYTVLVPDELKTTFLDILLGNPIFRLIAFQYFAGRAHALALLGAFGVCVLS